MRSILRIVVLATTCIALLAAPVAADGGGSAPPDPKGDPTDPHGVTMRAPIEVVLSDAGRTAFLFTWLVPCIVW
jgi:hypothetical protein